MNGNTYVNGINNTNEHVLPRRPASHEPAIPRFARAGTRNRLSDPALLAHVGDQFQDMDADAAARLDLTAVVAESSNGVNGPDKNEAVEDMAARGNQ